MSDDEESFHSADEGETTSGHAGRKRSSILHMQDEMPLDFLATGKQTVGETEDPNRPTDLKLKRPLNATAEPKTNSVQQMTNYVTGAIKKVADSARQTEAEQSAPVTDGWDCDWGTEVEDELTEQMVTPGAELHSGKLVLDVDSPPDRPQTSGAKKQTVTVETEDAPGWSSGWGSLLSAATDGLNTFTHTVGEGLTDVMESVQGGLGLPTPEELAKMSLEERLELVKKADEVKEPWPKQDTDDCGSGPEEEPDTATGNDGECSSGYQSDSLALGAQHLFTGVTSTGKSLVSGSFDVLEAIGKKTFDALTVADEDAGGRRRFILTQQSTNLSQVLRDRKQRAEQEATQHQADANARLASYAYYFEKLEGLIQLEGLEMVSANCSRQLETADTSAPPVETALAAVADVFAEYLDSNDSYSEALEQDFEASVSGCIEELAVPFNTLKLVATQGARRYYIDSVLARQADGIHSGSQEILNKAVESMADLTARSVEALHKMSQLLLISYSPKLQPRALTQLGDVLCTEVSLISVKFSDAYNAASQNEGLDTDTVGAQITTLFLEANNSCNYIRESLRLLLPVLQFAIVDVHKTGAALS